MINKIYLLGLFLSLIIISCTDPDTLGLEVHPTSDIISFGDTTSFLWQTSQTESVDSVQTDNALKLVLGEITTDPVFGYSRSDFYTQILLEDNNVELGLNPQVDSVILSYTYSDYYGELGDFQSVDVNRIYEDLHKDSVYYSSSFSFISPGGSNWVEEYNIDEENNRLRIKLDSVFGLEILNLGNEGIVDNETFLQLFQGISVSAQSENTMLYLNPNGSNSYFKIYYHNDNLDSLSLDFELGGDAARVNLFNPKVLDNIFQVDGQRYIQSMAGSRLKVSLENLDNIRTLLSGKVLNKVILTFETVDQTDMYPPHNELALVQVTEYGFNDNLPDDQPGSTSFGGELHNGKYEFNITLYFNDILNSNSDKVLLYLFSAPGKGDANRTILKEDIKLTIHYSEL